jgi:hypothetical protein
MKSLPSFWLEAFVKIVGDKFEVTEENIYKNLL